MRSNIARWILFADLVWLNSVAVALVGASGAGIVRDAGSHAVSLGLVSGIWILLFLGLRLDGFRRGWHLASVISLVIVGVALFAFLVGAGWSVAGIDAPRREAVAAMAALAAGFVLIRGGARAWIAWKMARGGGKRVVVLGATTTVAEVASRLARHPELLCQVIGFLLPNGAQDQFPRQPVSESTNMKELPSFLQCQRVDGVVAVVPEVLSLDLMNLLDSCHRAGIEVSMVPEACVLAGTASTVVQVDGLQLLWFAQHHPSLLWRLVKRSMDLVLALVMLVLAAPIILVCAALLYVRNGEAFSRQTYCGKEGRPFSMYCLAVDRWREDLPAFERTLRLLRLTELPQLLNVLRGEMSLVGPRPQAPETVKHYSEWLKRRLSVKPGLTGLAQINTTRLLLRRTEREVSPLERLSEQYWVEEKARFDLRYITEFDPAYDLSLILQTPWNLATRLWECRASRARVRAH